MGIDPNEATGRRTSVSDFDQLMNGIEAEAAA